MMKGILLVGALSSVFLCLYLYERKGLMTVSEAATKVAQLSTENYGCGRWEVKRVGLGEGRPQYSLLGCGTVEAMRLYNVAAITSLNAEIERAQTLPEIDAATHEIQYRIAKAALRDSVKDQVRGIDKAFANWGRN